MWRDKGGDDDSDDEAPLLLSNGRLDTSFHEVDEENEASTVGSRSKVDLNSTSPNKPSSSTSLSSTSLSSTLPPNVLLNNKKAGQAKSYLKSTFSARKWSRAKEKAQSETRKDLLKGSMMGFLNLDDNLDADDNEDDYLLNIMSPKPLAPPSQKRLSSLKEQEAKKEGDDNFKDAFSIMGHDLNLSPAPTLKPPSLREMVEAEIKKEEAVGPPPKRKSSKLQRRVSRRHSNGEVSVSSSTTQQRKSRSKKKSSSKSKSLSPSNSYQEGERRSKGSKDDSKKKTKKREDSLLPSNSYHGRERRSKSPKDKDDSLLRSHSYHEPGRRKKEKTKDKDDSLLRSHSYHEPGRRKKEKTLRRTSSVRRSKNRSKSPKLSEDSVAESSSGSKTERSGNDDEEKAKRKELSSSSFHKPRRTLSLTTKERRKSALLTRSNSSKSLKNRARTTDDHGASNLNDDEVDKQRRRNKEDTESYYELDLKGDVSVVSRDTTSDSISGNRRGVVRSVSVRQRSSSQNSRLRRRSIGSGDSDDVSLGSRASRASTGILQRRPSLRRQPSLVRSNSFSSVRRARRSKLTDQNNNDDDDNDESVSISSGDDLDRVNQKGLVRSNSSKSLKARQKQRKKQTNADKASKNPPVVQPGLDNLLAVLAPAQRPEEEDDDKDDSTQSSGEMSAVFSSRYLDLMDGAGEK